MTSAYDFPPWSVDQDDEDGPDLGDGGDDWLQGKTLVKPPEQLDLTEAVSIVYQCDVLQSGTCPTFVICL